MISSGHAISHQSWGSWMSSCLLDSCNCSSQGDENRFPQHNLQLQLLMCVYYNTNPPTTSDCGFLKVWWFGCNKSVSYFRRMRRIEVVNSMPPHRGKVTAQKNLRFLFWSSFALSILCVWLSLCLEFYCLTALLETLTSQFLFFSF